MLELLLAVNVTHCPAQIVVAVGLTLSVGIAVGLIVTVIVLILLGNGGVVFTVGVATRV